MTGAVADRPTPFDLVFADAAERAFPAIRRALAEAERRATDRDAFLLTREASSLIRELRPEEGAGDAIAQLVALVHHAYLFWEAGRRVIVLAPDRARALLAGPAPRATGELPERYVRFPPRLLWAQVVPDGPHEPLDGLFVHRSGDGVAALGVFGLRADRDGFSVVEAVGPPETGVARPNGDPLFAPVVPGGEAAGLHSIVSPAELLALAARALAAEGSG